MSWGGLRVKTPAPGKMPTSLLRANNLHNDSVSRVPKKYCTVLVALEGSVLWGNTLTTALLHDQNRTILFGLIVPYYFYRRQARGSASGARHEELTAAEWTECETRLKAPNPGQPNMRQPNLDQPSL